MFWINTASPLRTANIIYKYIYIHVDFKYPHHRLWQGAQAYQIFPFQKDIMQ